MVISGLGQGISVAIILGSIPVLIYTIIGGILWQFVVRPIEENNLLLRFGKEYETYRKNIKCWIPTFKR